MSLIAIAPIALQILDMINEDDSASSEAEIIVNSVSSILSIIENRQKIDNPDLFESEPTQEEIDEATNKRRAALAKARNLADKIRAKQNGSQ